MNNIQIFAKALLEQIEVARVRQLSGLKESANVKHTDTARAIRIFQKNLGLDQTGVPDPKTMHMIKMVAEAEQSLWGKYAPTWLGGDPAKPAAPAPKPAPKPAAPATQPAGGAPAGKSDPAVLKQQQDLIAKGAKIKADGIMGPATQAAIKQFGGAAAPAAPAAGDAAKNPVGTTNAATAIPTGGLENPANQAKPPAAPAAPAAPDTAAADAAAHDALLAQGPGATAPAADTTTAGGAAMANKPAAAPAAAPAGMQGGLDGEGGDAPAAAPAAPKKGLISQAQKDAMMAQVKAMTAAQAGGAANPAAGAAAMAN